MSFIFIAISAWLMYFIFSKTSLSPEFLTVFIIAGLWEIWDKLNEIKRVLEEKK